MEIPHPHSAEDPFPARAALDEVRVLAGEALSVVPRWPLATRQKASALRRLGRPADALTLLDVAEVDEDAHDRVKNGIEKARALADLNRPAEALECLGGLPSEAMDGPIGVECADLLADLSDSVVNDRGLRWLKRLVAPRAGPGDAGFYRIRARVYLRERRLTKAAEDLGRAREIDGAGHPETCAALAELALAGGIASGSREPFARALRGDPRRVAWQQGLLLAEWVDGRRNLPQRLAEWPGPIELHEQVEQVASYLDLLEPTLGTSVEFAAVRQMLQDAKASLDQMAAST